jgi:hypothetical protein
MDLPDETDEITVDLKRSGISPSEALADPLIGIVLAEKYQILELIGTGGFGSVYKAVHLTLDTDIAVKIIHRHLTQDEECMKRLENEAKLLNQLNSPGIIRIMDYGKLPAPYIVMEYFDGIPLNQYLKKNGRLPASLAVELFIQICDGLTAAQALGLVHRDLKPANLLIKINGNLITSKILDFGIAKVVGEESGRERLTATGEILGSPPYMSPEQWAGRCDYLSDIYSLGCIMYEVLSGKPAFSATYGMDYLDKHLNSTPLPMKTAAPEAKVPLALENIALKCMQKQGKNRYQSSVDISADLQRVKAGVKVKIVLPERQRFLKKRTLVALLLSGLLGIPLLLGLALTGLMAIAFFINPERFIANFHKNFSAARLRLRPGMDIVVYVPSGETCRLFKDRASHAAFMQKLRMPAHETPAGDESFIVLQSRDKVKILDVSDPDLLQVCLVSGPTCNDLRRRLGPYASITGIIETRFVYPQLVGGKKR